MKQQGWGSLGLLRVLMLHWNSHPYFLIFVRSKSKVTPNISNCQKWQRNTQKGKYLFTVRYSLWGEKLKTCWERLCLFSGCFIKVFYKTTTFPRQPQLIDILYRFDCTESQGNPVRFQVSQKNENIPMTMTMEYSFQVLDMEQLDCSNAEP